jgi:hypothetical protein
LAGGQFKIEKLIHAIIRVQLTRAEARGRVLMLRYVLGRSERGFELFITPVAMLISVGEDHTFFHALLK